MRNFTLRIRFLRTLLSMLILANLGLSMGYSQGNLPFVFENKSECPDDQICVGLIGRVNDIGVLFDCVTSRIKTMQLTSNTIANPTNGGNPGHGGNSKYAKCFTKLSNIPNKILNLTQIASVRNFIVII